MADVKGVLARRRVTAGTITALVAAAVGLPIVFLISFGWLTYDSFFSAARQQLARTVELLREHAIKVFETHQLIAGQVEEILAQRSDDELRRDEAVISRRLKELADGLPQVQDIWVLDRDGHPLVSANVYPVPGALDLSDRSYYRVFRDRLLSANALYISGVLRGRVHDVTFFQVSKERRSAATGEFSGVIAVSVQPRYFQSFYREVTAGGLDTMTLIRADGAVLARHPEQPNAPSVLGPESAFIRNATASPEGGVYETVSAFDGVPRFIGYQRLPKLPVYVTAGIDRNAIVAKWRSALAKQSIFVFPVMVGLLALAFLALRFFRREHAALSQAQEEAARREAVEAQLRQAQKMEAIGRLTGGVAHDFNNLLTIVIGNLGLLKTRLPASDPAAGRLVEHAREGARRAADLTQRLLAFSRQQPLLPVPINANRLIVEMSDLLRRALDETIEMETILDSKLWPFSADLNQLENVILNLVVNARDAMPNGGKLTIETANTHLDAAYAERHQDVSAGQYVMIAICDNGTGMTEDVRERAFEPFFTTKPAGRGTGLGLSQTYGFVKQSGGHIFIRSEVGKGSVVKLYLPRLRVAADQQTAVPGEPGSTYMTSPGAGKMVLVVEDDALVRKFACEVLQAAGYRVIAAEGSVEAVAAVRENLTISLLFTDVVLSGAMDGCALAEEIKRINPAIKVLFTTGYTRNAIIRDGRPGEDVNFIAKPYGASALVAKVSAVIRSPAPILPWQAPTGATSGKESAPPAAADTRNT